MYISSILTRLKFGKTVFFMMTVGVAVVYYMLYASTVDYYMLYRDTPERSTKFFNLTKEVFENAGAEDAEADVEMLTDFFKSQSTVKNVWVYKVVGYPAWDDKEREESAVRHIHPCIYNERYYEYIDGSAPASLGEKEVILPRYYMSQDKEGDENNKYVDASRLVGTDITFISHLKDSDTNEEYDVEVTMRVAATYDNARAGNGGYQLLVGRDSALLDYRYNRNYNKPSYYNEHLAYRLYVRYEAGKERIDEGSSYPEGYEMLEYAGGGRDYDIDISERVSKAAIHMDSYRENIFVYGFIIPPFIIALYVAWGVKRRRVLKQLAECFFCIIIAYVTGIGLCLYIAYRHNGRLADIYSFDKYYIYKFDSIPLLVVVGVLLTAAFTLLHIADIKKNIGEYEEDYYGG